MEMSVSPQEMLDMAVREIESKEGVMGMETIDEVALCFSTAEHLDSFVEASYDLGLEHFNSVKSDTMTRQDAPGEFEVRFEFLRFPEFNWRIEAMVVLGGKAPLHEAALAAEGSPVVVHLSYKLSSIEDYRKEVEGMLEAGVTQRAEYANSYGMFSYWGPADSEHPYLKPRVNLRDQAQLSLQFD